MSVPPGSPPSRTAPLIALSALGLDYGEVVPGLQEICHLTGLFFQAPLCAVTWLTHSVPAILWCSKPRTVTARMLAQCSRQVLQTEGVLVLEEKTLNKLYATDTPIWSEGPIRFFAAAPVLLTDQRRVGALCIADYDVRAFSATDTRNLNDFATLVSETLRHRKTLTDSHRHEQLLNRNSRFAKLGRWEYNVITDGLTLSTQVLAIYGLSPSAQPTLDMMLRRFYPGDSLIATREDFARLMREGKGYDARRKIQHLDGSSRWVHIWAEPEQHEQQVVRVHGLIEDVTHEIAAQQRLHVLTYTDTLTGLPNRNALLLELDRYFFQQQPIALIAIDIDNFKDINNTLGHPVGDQVLTTLGQRITAYFSIDTFIARVGSNTFILLIAEGSTTQDTKLKQFSAQDTRIKQLESLQRHLQAPLPYAQETLTLSISIGFCQAPSCATNTDELIRSADIALYEAKKAGGNRNVVFEPKMRQHIEARAQLLRDVRRGIERKEFLLYYQPIYNMQTQTLSGLEALMRWSLPEKGIMAPGYFEAAFNDQTLAPQLGDTALRSAFTQMRHWVEQGFDFKRVSVNVATAQFYPEGLAAHILGMLKEYQLQPYQLTLEITENVYLGPDADTVEHTLRALHEAGVKIALDDFGTGYASLTQLQRLPIDSIKIDKSFVQNPSAHPIVDAIIALGQDLDMQVVAEGIETNAHQNTLLQSGCRYGQGYYLGKPMPAEFYA